jgi:hypothetical protein
MFYVAGAGFFSLPAGEAWPGSLVFLLHLLEQAFLVQSISSFSPLLSCHPRQ